MATDVDSMLTVPDKTHVETATNRLVQACDPLRVLVFGSFAKGKPVPGSDLDFLVVLPHVENKRTAAVALRRVLADLPVPKDVIVTTPEEIDRRGGIVGREALRDGNLVYERGANHD